MTKPSDVCTTLGQECGYCERRHPTVREARRCLANYIRREFSDRRVVAVAIDASWPPVHGRDMNDAELDGAGMATAGELTPSVVVRTGCRGPRRPCARSTQRYVRQRACRIS